MELYGLYVLSLWVWVASADRHTVFWNSSNTRFLWDDYTVEVRLNDYLDIVCPHYEEEERSLHSEERYTLFLVEEDEYNTCKPQSKDQVRWECNKPYALHGPEKFSEKFQRFTPFTLGKEFKEGGTYYYISKPIHHKGESCLKLKVRVAGKATQPPLTNVHTPRARVQSDEPVEEFPGVLKSIANNSSLRGVPVTILCLLLPVILLLV
ncbi:ephrin-A1 [Discoglossus pictus]